MLSRSKTIILIGCQADAVSAIAPTTSTTTTIVVVVKGGKGKVVKMGLVVSARNSFIVGERGYRALWCGGVGSTTGAHSLEVALLWFGRKLHMWKAEMCWRLALGVGVCTVYFRIICCTVLQSKMKDIRCPFCHQERYQNLGGMGLFGSKRNSRRVCCFPE